MIGIGFFLVFILSLIDNTYAQNTVKCHQCEDKDAAKFIEECPMMECTGSCVTTYTKEKDGMKNVIGRGCEKERVLTLGNNETCHHLIGLKSDGIEVSEESQQL